VLLTVAYITKLIVGCNVFSINASQVLRQIHYTKRAVFKQIGDRYTKELYKAFEELVIETPQWSGTAAASWNMSLGESSGGVREQPKRSKKNALVRGHMAAVGVALSANVGRLDEIADLYRIKDVVIWNDAESAFFAEYGPLRSVNEPGMAFERFKVKVLGISFDLQMVDI